ncbi:glycosyltransferase family 2 protein [Candidatus Microgenomates bacterium]|nr:MAG: glycosyltransferase family 2 protein [Candidatus Microgenomates bacterium]
MNISVIIPSFNEENSIVACLESLSHQTREFELIVVDDGSTDATLEKVKNANYKPQPIILRNRHEGPAAARNLGAQKASGEILVFVDSDMTFDEKFLELLVSPIEAGSTLGTFSKEEYVANWNNVWARCWNYNQGIKNSRRIPENYPDTAPVFRAIKADEFRKVKGFTSGVGWTDDWSLSEKLGVQSTATKALCYHENPGTLTEVFTQAKWIGKNEFISGVFLKSLINLLRYSFPVSLVVGLGQSIRLQLPAFVLFKIVYDLGIVIGIIEVLFGNHRNK